MNRQQVWKIVGVILLVCGLQLYGQQRASGEEDEAKALTYITFNFTGSAADSVYIQYMAINPAGAITGYYVDRLDLGGIAHGFLRAPNGALTTFDCPSSRSPNFPNASPSAINPAGAIAGTYFDETAGVNRGFLRTPGGTFTPFDPPGNIYTQAPYAINPAGAITGIYNDGTQYRGFLRAPNGNIIAVDPLGSTYTQPYGINPAGEITGYYLDAGGIQRGFLRIPAHPDE